MGKGHCTTKSMIPVVLVSLWLWERTLALSLDIVTGLSTVTVARLEKVEIRSKFFS